MSVKQQQELSEIAKSVVDAFLSRGSAAVSSSFSSLVAKLPLVESKTDQEMTEEILRTLSAEGPWLKILRERRESITGFVQPKLSNIPSYVPTFTALVDGSVNEEDFWRYRNGLVGHASLLEMRVKKLQESVAKARFSVLESAPIERSSSEDGALRSFNDFASGLAEELGRTASILSESPVQIACTQCLAKIVDRVIESMYDYEVAWLFVEHLAAK